MDVSSLISSCDKQNIRIHLNNILSKIQFILLSDKAIWMFIRNFDVFCVGNLFFSLSLENFTVDLRRSYIIRHSFGKECGFILNPNTNLISTRRKAFNLM